jgi:hypothetical protein
VLSSTEFELLLPWYLNGTLTDRERALVVDYLKAHPEQEARIQWNASLRAGIKAHADTLPEDLGLARILAALNREEANAASARPAVDRHGVLADVALWLASLGRSRGKRSVADSTASADFRRPPGASLGRFGIRPWVAATASVVIVSVTLVIVVMNTTEPGRPFGAVFSEDRSRSDDRLASRNAKKPPEEEAAGQQVAPSTGQASVKAGSTTEANRPALASASKTPTEYAKRRAGGNKEPGTRHDAPTPIEGRQPEPTQLAEAPDTAATNTPPSEGNEATGSGSPMPKTERLDARPGALGASPPNQQPPSTDAGAYASSGNVPAVKPSRRDTESRRLAISGKPDTSCPSADKQREDALRAANPDQPVRTPADWLEFIRELRKAGCREAADKEWTEFQKTYPNEKVPDEFKDSK